MKDLEDIKILHDIVSDVHLYLQNSLQYLQYFNIHVPFLSLCAIIHDLEHAIRRSLMYL